MIIGVGTDLAHVPRIEAALDRHGERFAWRLLGADELARWQQTQRSANWLAKRFAAKEAFAKAMGTGFRDGLYLRHVQVVNDAMGKPMLSLAGPAADYVRSRQARCHLSLSDDGDYALAFVVIDSGLSART